MLMVHLFKQGVCFEILIVLSLYIVHYLSKHVPAKIKLSRSTEEHWPLGSDLMFLLLRQSLSTQIKGFELLPTTVPSLRLEDYILPVP